MKSRFTTLSFQTKILCIIGFGILTVTVLQLILLSGNNLGPAGTTGSALPYHAVMILLNGALFLVLALLIRYLFARHIQAPLENFSRLVQPQALFSDLREAQSLPPSVCLEIDNFSTTIAATRSASRTLLEQMLHIAEPLLEASYILLSSSQAQASRTGFHAPSHQDMRNSIQELVTTTKQVDQDIHAMVDIVSDTLRVANRGRQTVLNAGINMEDIQRSSRTNAEKIVALEKQTEHIHEVVATIDNIIEDTKLIAFNATIEAARAKDEGKGFSVVALEVKRLADEVFEATEDIKEFIRDIQLASHALVVSTTSEVKSVQHGSALAEEAELALQQMYDLVARTVDAARQIAGSTRQQQETSEHVLQIVGTTTRSIDQLGRDMRTFVSTSERLHQQAESLVQMLKQPFPERV